MMKGSKQASEGFVAVRKGRKSRVIDPYRGLPAIARVKKGESGERRAFRRFPITAHKPGGW
jgi:hypothetical protein